MTDGVHGGANGPEYIFGKKNLDYAGPGRANTSNGDTYSRGSESGDFSTSGEMDSSTSECIAETYDELSYIVSNKMIANGTVRFYDEAGASYHDIGDIAESYGNQQARPDELSEIHAEIPIASQAGDHAYNAVMRNSVPENVQKFIDGHGIHTVVTMPLSELLGGDGTVAESFGDLASSIDTGEAISEKEYMEESLEHLLEVQDDEASRYDAMDSRVYLDTGLLDVSDEKMKDIKSDLYRYYEDTMSTGNLHRAFDRLKENGVPDHDGNGAGSISWFDAHDDDRQEKVFEILDKHNAKYKTV